MEALHETTWSQLLAEEMHKPYAKDLSGVIEDMYQTEVVFPSRDSLFTAFSLCRYDDLRVVILGQDPYHGNGQAHGLAFSVPDGVKIPPSLRNIYKELSTDIGKPLSTSGNLESWARQGVLLLNTTLTVAEGRPASHQGLGWEQFTDAVLAKISNEKNHIVFILWGNHARAKKTLIDTTKHLVLEAPHPSPLSAYNGFFGSKPFSQTNTYLKDHDVPPIDW